MTADPFLKVSAGNGEVLIKDRTGKVLLRITGKHTHWMPSARAAACSTDWRRHERRLTSPQRVDNVPPVAD